MKMPCTQHGDQDQQGRRASSSSSFATNFHRALATLRFPDQQNLQRYITSSPSNHHHHHHHHHNQHSSHNHHHHVIAEASISSSEDNHSDDLTEQIRISVQDTHISQQAFPNDLGGNISDILDSYEVIASDDGRNQSEQFYENRPNSFTRSNIQELNGQSAPSQRSDIYTPHSSNYVPTCPADGVLDSNSTTNTNDSNQDQAKFSQLNGNDELKRATSEVERSANQLTTSILASANYDCLLSANQFVPTPIAAGIKALAVKQSATQSDRTSINESYNLIKDDELLECYHSFPPFTLHRQAGVIKNFLYNGSSFNGYQRSKNESYEVNVKIQHVDYASSYLCGYLCINHLTKTHPSLTTFFEGEIISEQHPFLTRKWDATEENDRAHWSKFEGFGRYSDTFNLDSFDYNELRHSDYIFMRWKEHFLVPDHTIKHVEGASYAGFYYICYLKRTAQIQGYYFHINSEHFESFQSLNLELDHQGSSQIYEFR